MSNVLKVLLSNAVIVFPLILDLNHLIPFTTYPPMLPHTHSPYRQLASDKNSQLKKLRFDQWRTYFMSSGLAGSNRGGVRRAQSSGQGEQWQRATAAGSQGGLRMNVKI